MTSKVSMMLATVLVVLSVACMLVDSTPATAKKKRSTQFEEEPLDGYYYGDADLDEYRLLQFLQVKEL